MKTKKLIPMIQFIIEIDWMTTSEFCQESGAPLPNIRDGVNSFLQIDAIKHRMFVEYAKFLSKTLTIDMFEGDGKIFEGGKYKDRQPSVNWNTYEIKGVVIFKDSNGQRYNSLGLKVCDLAGRGISYYAR